MESSHGPKPHVCFEVEKVIGISSDGSYRVQWAPTWVSKFHLVGCEHLIQEFLQKQSEKDKEHRSEQTLVSNELNQHPSERYEQNMDVAAILPVKEEFQLPELVVSDTENCGDTQGLQKHFIASDSSDVPRVSAVGESECRTSSAITPVNVEESEEEISNNQLSSLSIAGKDLQESDSKFPFDSYNVDISVKAEEEMIVVYPSDCAKDAMKQQKLSLNTSGHNDNTTRIYPTSDDKTSAITDGTPKSPLTHNGRIVNSPTMHTGRTESPSHPQATITSPLVHSAQTITYSPSSQDGPAGKPHLCVYCGKSYSLKHHLTRHIRSHTGEKPYKCQVCPKAFSRNNILKEHLRTHIPSERVTYSCDVCNRLFKQKHALKKHQQTHTDLMVSAEN